MDPIYQSAIDGTLKSPPPGQKMANFRIANDTPVDMSIRVIDMNGDLSAPFHIHPGDNLPSSGIEAFSGSYAVFTVYGTGAFACVIRFDAAVLLYKIDRNLLVRPNDIGKFPTPSEHILIPSDSARILVGYGRAKNNYPMTREQYWKRCQDSYALAAGEKRTIGYTISSGMQQTTSEEKQVSESLGFSTSIGWGPISASVSASLSTNTRSMQQVTVSTETTRYETIELTNDSETPRLFLRWQLIDVVTVFNPGGTPNQFQPLASIVVATLPTLVGGPYQLSQLGDRLLPTGQSS
jgi:hypothetical protein